MVVRQSQLRLYPELARRQNSQRFFAWSASGPASHLLNQQ